MQTRPRTIQTALGADTAMNTDRLLEHLATADADAPASPERAPARLKARIYSALVERLAETGPLRSLAATKADGARLCVFEETLRPLGDTIGSMNPCRVCHARVLGERLTRAPIFWPGCPYSKFHHG
jgi:hypothetical protein